MDRSSLWNQLVELLDRADKIQQTLLIEDQDVASQRFHEQLNSIADEFTDLANKEGIDIY